MHAFIKVKMKELRVHLPVSWVFLVALEIVKTHKLPSAEDTKTIQETVSQTKPLKGFCLTVCSCIFSVLKNCIIKWTSLQFLKLQVYKLKFSVTYHYRVKYW